MSDSRDGVANAGEKIVLAFPSSNQNVRADAQALDRAGMLALFCTTVALGRGSTLLQLVPQSLRARFQSRVFEEIDAKKIRSFPVREIIHQAARRVGLTGLTAHETGWASVDMVSKAFDEGVARMIADGQASASAIYAYEYAALRSFEAAARAGMRRFYELTIGYWRAGLRILGEERELNPAWAPTIELLHDSPAKREHKDAELRAADHIFVPSGFVRDTLREHPGFAASVDVIPYGAPPPRASARAIRPPSAPIRLLYVGQLNQRKGISYLFAAMRRLEGAASLTLIGPKPQVRCPALERELERHTWLGVLPHERVLATMAEQDLFVFPSLFEGLALVILEAMAMGLPVIGTVNSGAAEVVVDGREGFIVPIRDPTAIAERVARLGQDRERLDAMREAALSKAGELSWAAREARFIRVLKDRLAARPR